MSLIELSAGAPLTTMTSQSPNSDDLDDTLTTDGRCSLKNISVSAPETSGASAHDAASDKSTHSTSSSILISAILSRPTDSSIRKLAAMFNKEFGKFDNVTPEPQEEDEVLKQLNRPIIPSSPYKLLDEFDEYFNSFFYDLKPTSPLVSYGFPEQTRYEGPKTLVTQRAHSTRTVLPITFTQRTLMSDNASVFNSFSRGRLAHVPVNKKVHHAVADSGSTENVMSEAFALSQRFAISKASETSDQFVNARGSVFASVGQVTLGCSFPGESGRTLTTKFVVVPKLAVPLVFGQRFLDLTETLTRFRSRLKKISRSAFGHAKLLHMDIPRRRLPISLNGESVLANADTGSDIDLISAEYARKRGLIKTGLQKREKFIKLADGVVVKLLGKVCTTLEVEGAIVPRQTFYVMKNLTSDVLLGNDTLEALRVFEDHAESFVGMPGDGSGYDMNLITWKGIFKKKSQEVDFESQLEAEDNREAARQDGCRRRMELVKPEDRAKEEQEDDELRRKYNERRKEMVRLRRIVTAAEFDTGRLP